MADAKDIVLIFVIKMTS